MSSLKTGLAALSSNAKKLVVIFTIVEVVILTLWLDALGIGTSILPDSNALAIGLLLIGLTIEHFIAAAAGKV